MSSNVNIPKLPAKNKSELTEQVFQAIVDSGETGIFQTELCKSFSIDSRDGSRLVGNLEKQSLISRERMLYKGRWTHKCWKVQLKHGAPSTLAISIGLLSASFNWGIFFTINL